MSEKKEIRKIESICNDETYCDQMSSFVIKNHRSYANNDLILISSDKYLLSKVKCIDFENYVKYKSFFDSALLGCLNMERGEQRILILLRDHSKIAGIDFKTEMFSRLVTNLSTPIREFDSIQRINSNFPLLNQTFLEKSTNLMKSNSKDLPSTESGIPLNSLQSRIVNHIADSCCDLQKKPYNIALVQGPPGTGKTQTILAIISKILGRRKGSRILVCAPSNNAIDELAVRMFRHFVINKHLPLIKDKEIIRYSANEIPTYADTYQFNEDKNLLKSVYIDTLLKKKNSKQINEIKGKIKTLELQYNIANSRERQQIKSHIDILKNRISSLGKYQTWEAELGIIESAKVVCTTLNLSGHLKLCTVKFDYVIVDECSQSIEPSCLIALEKSKNIVLLGDHMQLPPTVFNGLSLKTNFNRSIFERLLLFKNRAGLNIFFLNMQYRMDTSILNFISGTFYDGNIHSFTSKNELTQHFKQSLTFLNYHQSISLGNEQERNFSFVNPKEVEIVMKLTELIIEIVKQIGLELRIGVISFYKAQVLLIEETIASNKKYKDMISNANFEVNTVDSFQGKEKDIVIISCVRSNNEGSIGFLSESKRLNVAVSRSKKLCIVLGDYGTIEQSNNHFWKCLGDYCKHLGSFINISSESTKDEFHSLLIES